MGLSGGNGPAGTIPGRRFRNRVNSKETANGLLEIMKIPINNKPVIRTLVLLSALALFTACIWASISDIINEAWITCTTDSGDDIPFPETSYTFNRNKDLLALHYDFAPDKDDVHSAAADRSMLQTLHGRSWMCEHALPVSGTYGDNWFLFIGNEANTIMEKVWGVCGGYIDADRTLMDESRRNNAALTIAKKWLATLHNNGDIWVKEGGK
jgi:hypothetical protein